MDGGATSDPSTAIWLAVISGVTATVVALIGLLNARIGRNGSTGERRGNPRTAQDDLVTQLVNDVRADNEALREENHRLLGILEARGWPDD